MRVLLVEPPMSPFDVPQGLIGLPEPLPLEIIAAQMVGNHEVQILDLRVEQERELDRRLQAFDPQVVGVGAVTSNLHSALAVLRRAKAHDGRVLTLLGGHHVTFSPQDGLVPEVDVIVIGEADHSAAEVVDAHERGLPRADVPGLVLNQDGTPLRTAPRPLLDLDSLPWPARDLVAGTRDRYFQRGYRPIVSLNSSRGCTNHCKFCTLWKMNRRVYRTRSAEKVVEEMASLEQRFVDFIDDNTIEDIPRARRIAELLLERGVDKRMKLYGRSDTIARNEQTIERLAEAGLELILVGFEACTDETLGRLNKRSSARNNSRAIEILRRCGVRIAAYFVVDPAFTVEDFDALWRYVDEMELTDPVFTILCPFPGSDLYAEREADIVWRDHRLFDFFHTVLRTRLPLEQFYEQFALLYRRAYARERQLTKNIADIPPEELRAYAAAFAEIMRRLDSLDAHHRLVQQAPAR
jgi:radical SAM superfamily enzyme YgiQ (UPF0313 family)